MNNRIRSILIVSTLFGCQTMNDSYVVFEAKPMACVLKFDRQSSNYIKEIDPKCPGSNLFHNGTSNFGDPTELYLLKLDKSTPCKVKIATNIRYSRGFLGSGSSPCKERSSEDCRAAIDSATETVILLLSELQNNPVVKKGDLTMTDIVDGASKLTTFCNE